MKRLLMIGLVLLFTVSMVFAGGQQESGEKGDGPMKVALLLSGLQTTRGGMQLPCRVSKRPKRNSVSRQPTPNRCR